MSKSLKLVIVNSKSPTVSEPITRRQTLTPISKKQSLPLDLSDKINQLQGNLKMLEKKYRSNLKEGFDNKIKAYRLQAVVQRKMLKQAIQETQRAHQRQFIREKLQTNQHEKRLDQSRALIAQHQKQQRLKFVKLRNLRQKRGLSLSMHENKAQLEKQIKDCHDRIIEQQANIHRKRDYFDFIRKINLKKDELEQKKILLSKIVSNTEKLKDLKYTLEDIRGSSRQNTFVTM